MGQTRETHTPGPWRAERPTKSCECVQDGFHPERKTPYWSGGLAIRAGGSGTIANLSCDAYDVAEVCANARLIAAAPELLSALRGFILGCPDEKALAKLVGEDVIREARAALAKAEAEG